MRFRQLPCFSPVTHCLLMNPFQKLYKSVLNGCLCRVKHKSIFDSVGPSDSGRLDRPSPKLLNLFVISESFYILPSLSTGVLPIWHLY